MITEIAELTAKPGMGAQLEAGVARARPLFDRAKGCHGIELRRSIETPDRYLLLIQWETVEDHMVGFRESEDFGAWRALVSDFFAAPPRVEHVETIAI